MAVGLAHLRHRTTGVLVACLSVFVALAGLSYNAILFMPALLYGALFMPPAPPARLPVWDVRWSHALAIAGVVAASAAINYFGFIRPNLDHNIAGSGIGGADADWGARVLSLPSDVGGLFKHFFFNIGDPWSGPWLLALIAAAALVALVGLLHLCDHGGKGRPANLDCRRSSRCRSRERWFCTSPASTRWTPIV